MACCTLAPLCRKGHWQPAPVLSSCAHEAEGVAIELSQSGTLTSASAAPFLLLSTALFVRAARARGHIFSYCARSASLLSISRHDMCTAGLYAG